MHQVWWCTKSGAFPDFMYYKSDIHQFWCTARLYITISLIYTNSGAQPDSVLVHFQTLYMISLMHQFWCQYRLIVENRRLQSGYTPNLVQYNNTHPPLDSFSGIFLWGRGVFTILGYKCTMCALMIWSQLKIISEASGSNRGSIKVS